MASGIIFDAEYQVYFDKPKWTLEFCWLPRRSVNGKLIWMTKAYCAFSVWLGSEHSAKYRWMTPKEYMFALLKE